MKLTLVIMEMIMGKEVDVKVDWEVDEVGEDVPIFRMNKNVFFWKQLKNLKSHWRECWQIQKLFKSNSNLKILHYESLPHKFLFFLLFGIRLLVVTFR